MQLKKHNIQLIALLVIFIFPVIGGWMLYHYRGHIEFKTINHGTLVHPPVLLRDINITTTKKWQIIYAPKQCCDKQCDTTMYTLHQLRKAFGKDSERIDLAVMMNDSCALQDPHDFAKIILSEWQQAQLKAKFFQWEDKIYLADPLGNLFMYYPATVDPIHLLTDLKRVLEVSQIG
jgi:hypothetical protein